MFIIELHYFAIAAAAQNEFWTYLLAASLPLLQPQMPNGIELL